MADAQPAVADPGLAFYPPPVPFFGVLMTGEHTLAEAFTLANTSVSWRVICLGDPLYNPFRTHPYAKIDQVLKESQLPVDLSPANYEPVPQGPEELKPEKPLP